MSLPQRIQRKRTKGWKMPEGAVYVGRPSVWGNDFQVGRLHYRALNSGLDLTGMKVRDRAHAVELYERWQLLVDVANHDIRELRGKDLACWCPLSEPCHADVLLEIANRE